MHRSHHSDHQESENLDLAVELEVRMAEEEQKAAEHTALVRKQQAELRRQMARKEAEDEQFEVQLNMQASQLDLQRKLQRKLKQDGGTSCAANATSAHGQHRWRQK